MDDRDQPASTTVPQAPQTRSSLSFPVGNSKERRALKSIMDAAGWGLPIVRSLVCVRVTAESFRQERHQIGKPRASLQGSVIGQHSRNIREVGSGGPFGELYSSRLRGAVVVIVSEAGRSCPRPNRFADVGNRWHSRLCYFHGPNVAAPRYRRGRRDNDPPSGGQRLGGGGF